MERLIALLLALLLSASVGLSSTTHAMEPIASIGAAEACLLGHWAGDADEVPADADKGYPHHHGGCHDHGVSVPATAQGIGASALMSQVQHRQRDAILTSTVSDTLRRPPRA